MTIYAKLLLTTASTLIVVNIPKNTEFTLQPKPPTHDVERLIGATEDDIRNLEIIVDSMLISRCDSLIIKKLNNATVNIK